MGYGKIARLPPEVREQLNRRLADAEPGFRLVDWLNGLPEVRQMLAEDFGGLTINEQNLTNWRQGGHQEWRKLQQVRELCTHMAKVPEAVPTLEQLTTLTVANYLVRIRGRTHCESPKAWREFRRYCHDVMKFRRVEIQAGRLDFDLERLEFDREKLTEKKKTIAGRVVEVLLTLGPEVRAALAKGGDAEHSTTNIQRSTSKGGDGPSPLRGGAQTELADCPPSPQSSPPGRGGNLARFPVRGDTITSPVVGESHEFGNKNCPPAAPDAQQRVPTTAKLHVFGNEGDDEDENEDEKKPIKVNQGEKYDKKSVPDGPAKEFTIVDCRFAIERQIQVNPIQSKRTQAGRPGRPSRRDEPTIYDFQPNPSWSHLIKAN